MPGFRNCATFALNLMSNRSRPRSAMPSSPCVMSSWFGLVLLLLPEYVIRPLWGFTAETREHVALSWRSIPRLGSTTLLAVYAVALLVRYLVVSGVFWGAATRQ